MKFPHHESSMTLIHNEHKMYHQTVAQSVDEQDHGYKDEDWVSEEQKARAIATNECWTLQWYPKTSGGFCLLSAADLDVLIESASA